MTGYQEVITDPSYRGQIVAMTYPMIGNYGVNPADNESAGPHIRAFVIGELCEIPSNYRSTESLSAYLERHDILGIEGIDTRALTIHLRSLGAMRACVTTELSEEEAVAAAKNSDPMEGADFVKEVTTKEAYIWDRGIPEVDAPQRFPGRKRILPGTPGAEIQGRRPRSRPEIQPAPHASPGRLRGRGRPRHTPPPRISSRENPTGSSSPTALAIRPLSITSTRKSRNSSPGYLPSVSASETSFSHTPTEEKPSSSSSATAAATSPSKTSAPGKFPSPPRTTVSRSIPTPSPTTSRSPTSISTTTPSKACATRSIPSSPCNTTPRPPRAQRCGIFLHGIRGAD